MQTKNSVADTMLPLSGMKSLCPSGPVNSQGDACASLHQLVFWCAPGLPLKPWQMVLKQKKNFIKTLTFQNIIGPKRLPRESMIQLIKILYSIL